MSKYLITGGAGAIGSYLVNILSQNKKDKIDVIDNLYSGYKENINKAPNVKLYVGSISDEKFLKQFDKQKYDYIYHLAAFFANQQSVDFPIKDMEFNIQGTINMLELAKKQKNLLRFVYTSSSCVYGASTKVMKESDIPNPETPYAISKLSGEHYTNYYFSHFKMPTCVVRLFNVYGSNERPGKYRNVIPNFVYKAMRGQDITIMGNGSDERDFTHIDDVIEILLKVSTHPKSIGETFNIGSNSRTTIIKLAKRIIKDLKSPSKIVFVPKRSWDKVNKRRAHIHKIRKHKKTKFKPLHHGLKSVYKFMETVPELAPHQL